MTKKDLKQLIRECIKESIDDSGVVTFKTFKDAKKEADRIGGVVTWWWHYSVHPAAEYNQATCGTAKYVSKAAIKFFKDRWEDEKKAGKTITKESVNSNKSNFYKTPRATFKITKKYKNGDMEVTFPVSYRYNGGTIINNKWYSGYEVPSPKIPVGYKLVSLGVGLQLNAAPPYATMLLKKIDKQTEKTENSLIIGKEYPSKKHDYDDIQLNEIILNEGIGDYLDKIGAALLVSGMVSVIIYGIHRTDIEPGEQLKQGLPVDVRMEFKNIGGSKGQRMAQIFDEYFKNQDFVIEIDPNITEEVEVDYDQKTIKIKDTDVLKSMSTFKDTMMRSIIKRGSKRID